MTYSIYNFFNVSVQNYKKIITHFSSASTGVTGLGVCSSIVSTSSCKSTLELFNLDNVFPRVSASSGVIEICGTGGGCDVLQELLLVLPSLLIPLLQLLHPPLKYQMTLIEKVYGHNISHLINL